MVKRQTDTDSFTLTEQAGSGTGSLVATAVVAAAVGAGVALLFAPEKGVKTRKRLGRRMRKLELAKQFDELELGKRAARMGSGAAGGWKQFRKESARRLDPDNGGGMNKPLYALLGTLAGAAAAVLLAPDSGAETRERLGNKLRDMKDDASTRWQEHRAGRRGGTQNGMDAGNGSAAGSAAASAERDRNVRSVQELGREGSEVF
jgi:gas vesicle protein